MSKEEYVKAMTYMGLVFNKPIEREMLEVWYEFIKDIPVHIFKSAIKKLALRTRFLPSVQEIVAMCGEVHYENNNSILQKMYEDGYFHRCEYGKLDSDHALRNYDKANMWLKKGIIPKWLLEDMKEYGYVDSNLLLSNNVLLLGDSHD